MSIKFYAMEKEPLLIPRITWEDIMVGHYGDVKWPPRHFNSFASRLFVYQFAQDDCKGSVTALHHWLFLKGIHRWPVDIPQKQPVRRKAFPRDVIMYALANMDTCFP